MKSADWSQELLVLRISGYSVSSRVALGLIVICSRSSSQECGLGLFLFVSLLFSDETQRLAAPVLVIFARQFLL